MTYKLVMRTEPHLLAMIKTTESSKGTVMRWLPLFKMEGFYGPYWPDNDNNYVRLQK
jgi:hypothetical protein